MGEWTESAPRQRAGVLGALAAAGQRAREAHPAGPRNALLCTVLALLAFGMVIQLSHAATTLPASEFGAEMREQIVFRLLGAFLLIGGMAVGVRRIEPFIPAATVLSLVGLVLVFVPGFEQPINGAHRWIRVFGRGPSIQPSEIARVVFVLWVARRCALLEHEVTSLRRGFAPTIALGLLAGMLILREPDLGGCLLFLLCFGTTLFVGGARVQHVALVGVAAACTILVAASLFSHVAERFAVWTGDSTNSQVTRAAEAMASGDVLGVGFAQGGFRNAGLQYMQTDYALALVGEELGLVGILVVVGLFAAFAWHALRLVLAIRDRFAALAAFGRPISVAFQAMVHLQVVTGLAPPKGMALPFLSDGGSSLLASCLAVGLALGAARPHPAAPAHPDPL
ncbi:MAG: FtsW/RodA/SpoVE family cell cycle protein [Planctomycetota bacterium]